MAIYNKQLKELYKADYIIQNSFRCSVGSLLLPVFEERSSAIRFLTIVAAMRKKFAIEAIRQLISYQFDNSFVDKCVKLSIRHIFALAGTTQIQPRVRVKSGLASDRTLPGCWNDPHCGANIAGIGMRMLERHQLADVATFLHSLAIEEFNDPETMEQYALYLDFNLRKPEAAEKYYHEAASIQPPSLSRAVQYALYLQENGKGREQFLSAAKEIITAMSTLERSRGELLKEEDNICRGAVLLQLLANDMSEKRFVFPSFQC
ncbi:hypothetical protein ACSSS7_001959 [Eimeria intestinalis]